MRLPADIYLFMPSLRYLAWLLVGSACFSQTQPGPAVGTQIPQFELTDQNGKRQTLESISGPKGAMLVFFRSADW